jgi:VCBS repeat-containing protein
LLTVNGVGGSSASDDLVIRIVDDVPSAVADSGNVNEGALLSVNAASGVLANDTAGADGASIQGVRAAGADTTTPVTGGVGGSIAGLYGTLILNADGSYTYQSTANAISGAETDVFVYTLVDGDGDLSTTTLTINLADANLVAPADSDVTVNEAALDLNQDGSDLAAGTVTGSLPGSTAETDASNQLNATGGFGTLTYALVGSATGTYGTIQINSDGSYIYTLTDNHLNATADDGAQPINGLESFTYSVTDANGNTTTGSITVTIVDDVPSAVADSGNVNEGALLSVNAASGVLANDTAGADGASIQGVRAAGADTTTPVTGGVGGSIAGLYGTLILNADGSYTYQSTANAISGAETDVFVYTLVDGDGDLSTTTLTINLADANLVAPADSDVTVNEAALDLNQDGSDLAAGTVTGSLPGSTAETDASNQLNATGGFGTLTYALVGSATGTYGTIQINSDGSYIYTLTDNHLNATADDGAQPINGLESFTYSVTDANGNTTTGSITVTIVDDVPSAVAPDHAVVTNAAGSPVTFELDQDGTVTNNYGADGPGTVRFPSSLDGAQSGLTSGGTPITYQVSSGGLVLTGLAGATSIFVITLDPTNGTYAVDMNGTVDSTTNVNFSSGGYDFVGGNAAWQGFTSAANDSSDLLLTAVGGSVNTSANTGGVGNTFVDSGEVFRVDFVQDLAQVGQNGPFTFEQHYNTNGAAATLTAATNSTVTIYAKDDFGDGTLNPPGTDLSIGNGTVDPITAIGISWNGASLLITPTLTSTAYVIGGQTFHVRLNADGSVTVDGVVGTSGGNAVGTIISVFTQNGYSSLEFHGGGTDLNGVAFDNFQIGNFGASVPTTAPVSFDVPIEVVDGDGDTAESSIGVTLTPSGEGIQNFSASGSGVTESSTLANPHIIGSDFTDNLTGNSSANVLDGNDGNDFLSGGAGDDILIGGLGSDTMTGGSGDDTFVIGADSLGGSIDDFITDFEAGVSGDILDLTELLNGLASSTDLETGGYVQIVQNGANAEVQVDVDGGANNFQTVAVLQNHTFTNESVRVLFDDGTGAVEQTI